MIKRKLKKTLKQNSNLKLINEKAIKRKEINENGR